MNYYNMTLNPQEKSFLKIENGFKMIEIDKRNILNFDYDYVKQNIFQVYENIKSLVNDPLEEDKKKLKNEILCEKLNFLKKKENNYCNNICKNNVLIL